MINNANKTDTQQKFVHDTICNLWIDTQQKFVHDTICNLWIQIESSIPNSIILICTEASLSILSCIAPFFLKELIQIHTPQQETSDLVQSPY